MVDAGFRPAFSVERSEWCAYTFEKLSSPIPNSYFVDHDNFVFYAGYLYYRGRAGQPALEQLLEEARTGEIALDELQGHYALLICANGRLAIFNDPMNIIKIYHDPRHDVISSSFAMTFELLDDAELDAQKVYEYAWTATVSGTRTFFKNILMLPANQRLELSAHHTELSRTLPIDPLRPSLDRSSIRDIEDHYTSSIRSLFDMVVREAGGRVRTSLSGGYDSRLILAALLQTGITPDVYVYGNESDKDRICAAGLCDGEGIAIEAIDKTRQQPIAPDQSRANVERNFVMFDGWKPSGIFDGGVDFTDRLHRLRNVNAIVHGSGGEIFRNFFYLPNGRFTTEQLVWTFYSQHDPSACTDAFDQDGYTKVIAEQIAQDLGNASGLLTREQVEAAYPSFRLRYWSARDVALNQRFGWAIYPFLLPCLIKGTPTIPLRWKNYGRLEARLIRRLHPRLANYMSDYGFSFDKDPPWNYIAKMALTYARPPWLRRWTYRIKQQKPQPRPFYLADSYLSAVIDPGLPRMREFFRIDKIRDPEVFARVATMEYLVTRHQGRPVGPSNSTR
jgi:hypothetical protein